MAGYLAAPLVLLLATNPETPREPPVPTPLTYTYHPVQQFDRLTRSLERRTQNLPIAYEPLSGEFLTDERATRDLERLVTRIPQRAAFSLFAHQVPEVVDPLRRLLEKATFQRDYGDIQLTIRPDGDLKLSFEKYVRGNLTAEPLKRKLHFLFSLPVGK